MMSTSRRIITDPQCEALVRITESLLERPDRVSAAPTKPVRSLPAESEPNTDQALS